MSLWLIDEYDKVGFQVVRGVFQTRLDYRITLNWEEVHPIWGLFVFLEPEKSKYPAFCILVEYYSPAFQGPDILNRVQYIRIFP